VILDEVGVEYEVAGGERRVVGLFDLGQAENPAARQLLRLLPGGSGQLP
jgi:hypothetical protein